MFCSLIVQLNAQVYKLSDFPDTSSSVSPGIYPEVSTNKDTSFKKKVQLYVVAHLQSSGSFQFNLGGAFRHKSAHFSHHYALYGGLTSKLTDYTNDGLTFLIPTKSNYFNLTPNIMGRSVYQPNKWIRLEIGNDRHFFGEGYRSMVQSDQFGPNPFLAIKSQFWKIRYGLMYQGFFEQTTLPYKWKANALHYLTIRANKKLVFTLIESVQILTKDSTFNRGFELEYLNPLVFFRPQEYSLGSSDNVLLAGLITYKKKKTTFYGQLAIDDFSVAELRARSKWWGNKFAVQLGINHKINSKLVVRTEVNAIRPYMYAHLSKALNFAHQGSSIAHPNGSNLAEWLTVLYWKKHKYNFTFYNQLGVKGLDSTDAISFGGDVYKSYDTRPINKEYGTTIGQGITQQNWKIQVQWDMDLKNERNIYAIVGNNLTWGELKTKSIPYFQIGVRSSLFYRSKLF